MYKLTFVLNKNECLSLEKTWNMMLGNHCEAFDDLLWRQYKSSKDYSISKQLIELDITHCNQLYSELYKKALTLNKDNEFHDIVEITSSKKKDGFIKVYKRVINDYIRMML